MAPPSKRWDVAPLAPRRQRERLSHIHPLLTQILFNRGVTDPTEVDAFLHGRPLFYDPYRMLDMAKAVERIRAARHAGEPIVVYGDFDADGVTATVLLVQALQALGAQVQPYIPHRVDEGYGLNCDALDKIAAAGVRLVITVDCGIRSPVEAAHAAALGLDLIITDHHSIFRDEDDVERLPPALAVINPKRQGDPYPFKDLAGVGIARRHGRHRRRVVRRVRRRERRRQSLRPGRQHGPRRWRVAERAVDIRRRVQLGGRQRRPIDNGCRRRPRNHRNCTRRLHHGDDQAGNGHRPGPCDTCLVCIDRHAHRATSRPAGRT
jgi:hypothetical protein